MLAAAEEQAADDARAELVREAAAAIERFNIWLRAEYTAHADAIARGISLEKQAIRLREALRDRRTGHMPDGLPALSRAFVGSDSRSLEFLTRLPAVELCVTPPCWPR